MQTPLRLKFGDFVLDVAERTLTRRSPPAIENHGVADPTRVALQAKSFDLLVYLVTHAGRLHTKQALLDEVWQKVVVTENSLTRCISQLRTALDDTADEPRFIETVPKVGYRFIAAVVPDDAPMPAGLKSATPRARPHPEKVSPQRAVVSAIIAMLGIAAAYFVVDKLWLKRASEAAQSAPPSVAVLPFRNFGDDPVNEALADGLAETLLTMLAQIGDLRVIGRTSSFSFKGKDVDLRTIGETLGAGAVLEGSVQRSGDRLRINAQLISTVDGVQLWAEQFDRPTADIFAVQEEIARHVAEALKITLAGRLGPGSAGTQNFEAYRLNLEARQLLRSRQTVNVEKALPKLQRAVELDPNYGDAWVQLSDAYASSGFAEAARRAIDRALEVAPETAGPHLVHGYWLMHSGSDGAEEAMARGLELAPQDPDALKSVADQYRHSNRCAESAALMRRALKLDPRNINVRFGAAFAFEANDDLPGALTQIHEVLRLEPGMGMAYYTAGGMLYGTPGRMDEALRFIRRARVMEPTYPRPELVIGYALIGEDERALREIAAERSILQPDNQLILRAQVDLLAGREAAPRELLDQALNGDPPSRALLVAVDDFGLAPARHDAQQVLDRLRTVDPELDDYPPVCTLAWSGDRAGAIALLASTEEYLHGRLVYSMGTGDQNVGTFRARALACTGRNAEALAELERMVSNGYHAGGWRGLAADRAYDAIRADGRFEALLDRLRAAAEGERARFLERPDLVDADIDALVAHSAP